MTHFPECIDHFIECHAFVNRLPQCPVHRQILQELLFIILFWHGKWPLPLDDLIGGLGAVGIQKRIQQLIEFLVFALGQCCLSNLELLYHRQKQIHRQAGKTHRAAREADNTDQAQNHTGQEKVKVVENEIYDHADQEEF